jgi:hypothetical protein
MDVKNVRNNINCSAGPVPTFCPGSGQNPNIFQFSIPKIDLTYIFRNGKYCF